jgi:hypothetical protein
MGENRVLRGVGFGLIGGLVGTALMDLVMMATFLSVGEHADLFFTMVGERLGGTALLGMAIHNVTGMTGGLVFSLLVLNIGALELTSVPKGLKLGFAAGAITVPLGCIPLAIWIGESILDVVAFSILPHLVWGTVLGWTVASGLLKFETKQDASGRV